MRFRFTYGRLDCAIPLALLCALPAAESRGQTLQASDLRELAQRVDGLLRAELTRNWYPRAIDGEHGGFHQDFARDWSPLPRSNRFLVYQARMTWTAGAFAAYDPTHRDEFATYARHGIKYLDEVMRDREFGGFHWILDPRGRVDAALGDEKHVYGTAFVLYAASKVHEVTRDEHALKVARDAFDWLEAHAHDGRDGGYFEAIHRDGRPIQEWSEDAPLTKRTDRLGVYYGFKSMNSHIHLLEAVAAFARVEKKPLVEQRLRELHAIVRDRIAVEPGALNLYLTRDWRAVPAHDSFGHDVETAYLLVEAAEGLGMPDDAKTWRMARWLVDHALDWGWDDEHGGFYDKGAAFAGEAFDKTKVWWTQAEGLNALLLMHRKYGSKTDRYGKAFLKEWDFIARHQLDPVHGGWFMETTREGQRLGDGRKATPWKANYHTSRALMNVATLLRELAAGDKPEKRVLFDGESLDGWKKTDFAHAGEVEVGDGAIVLSAGKPMTGVTSTRDDLPRTDYELSYEARRLGGQDFFAAATFPVGDSFITLVNGGWGGGVTGLSSLGGADASENETSTTFKYRDKTWYRFRVRVTNSTIRCWIDDKEIVAVNYQNRNVATRIETRSNQPLGFATWETTGAIRKIQIRLLNPDEIAANTKAEQ